MKARTKDIDQARKDIEAAANLSPDIKTRTLNTLNLYEALNEYKKEVLVQLDNDKSLTADQKKKILTQEGSFRNIATDWTQGGKYRTAAVPQANWTRTARVQAPTPTAAAVPMDSKTYVGSLTNRIGSNATVTAVQDFPNGTAFVLAKLDPQTNPKAGDALCLNGVNCEVTGVGNAADNWWQLNVKESGK
jgi:hypothetical protein